MVLNKKQCAALAALLTDYAVVTDALDKIVKARYGAAVAVSSEDDKDYLTVELDKRLALNILQAQKSAIEAVVRQYGMEVSV